MSLAALLGPVAVSDIIGAFEARRLLRFPCGDGERLASLFGWPQFAAMLNMFATSSGDLRVTKNGKSIAPCLLNGTDLGGRIEGRAVENLARQKISLILNNLQNRCPALRGIWRQAETAFGSLELACIATFGPGEALAPHFDARNIVVVQIAGTKDWEILGEPTAVPVSTGSVPRPQGPVTARFTMRPGDVLALPYGLCHHCHAAAESLHIGLIMRRPRGEDYLDWLTAKVKTIPAFNRPAPFDCHDDEAMARHEAEIRQAMLALMDEFPVRDFVAGGRGASDTDVVLEHLPGDSVSGASEVRRRRTQEGGSE